MAQIIPHNQHNIMLAEIGMSGHKPFGREAYSDKYITIRHDVIIGWILPKNSENYRAITSYRPEPYRIDPLLIRIAEGAMQATVLYDNQRKLYQNSGTWQKESDFRAYFLEVMKQCVAENSN